MNKKLFFVVLLSLSSCVFAYNREEVAHKSGLPVSYIPIPTNVTTVTPISPFTVAKFKLEDAADTVVSNLSIKTISLVFISVLLFLLYRKVNRLAEINNPLVNKNSGGV